MVNYSGKVVAKFCAKYLHQQVKKNDTFAAGDIGTSVQKAFFRLFLTSGLRVRVRVYFYFSNCWVFGLVKWIWMLFL